METSLYILISKAFAERMSGKESDINPGSVFGYAVTTDEKYVCGINSANDFPNEFIELGKLTLTPIQINKFPVTPPIE